MSRQPRGELKQTLPLASLDPEAYLRPGRTWAVPGPMVSETLRPYCVTPTHYNGRRVLRGVGMKALCRSEVMERMIARIPDATRLLDRMEAAGLMDRDRSGADRRFVTTRITEVGLRLLAELDEAVEVMHRWQFEALDGEELRGLVGPPGLEREHA